MNREEAVNNIGYQQTIAAFEYASQHFDINKISERNAAYNGFEAGAKWMLEQYEKWLRKTGKGQLIGSLNRFLAGNTSYRI